MANNPGGNTAKLLVTAAHRDVPGFSITVPPSQGTPQS